MYVQDSQFYSSMTSRRQTTLFSFGLAPKAKRHCELGVEDRSEDGFPGTEAVSPAASAGGVTEAESSVDAQGRPARPLVTDVVDLCGDIGKMVTSGGY